MENVYCGEIELDIAKHPIYSQYTAADWAMVYIERYGQTDGSHHKAWVLDRVARILKGTPVLVYQASWSNGHTEDRFRLGQPSQEYLLWVKEMRRVPDDPDDSYHYDEGIAP